MQDNLPVHCRNPLGREAIQLLAVGLMVWLVAMVPYAGTNVFDFCRFGHWGIYSASPVSSSAQTAPSATPQGSTLPVLHTEGRSPESAENDEYWLKQIDHYGIVGPLLLGMCFWLIGLLVIVVQARSAARERARIGFENKETKDLLLKLADELEKMAMTAHGREG